MVKGSVNHAVAQRGVGRAAVAGGRPDNRITAESEGIKGARQPSGGNHPPKDGRHPEALRTALDVCDCWVLLCLSVSFCAFAMRL